MQNKRLWLGQQFDKNILPNLLKTFPLSILHYQHPPSLPGCLGLHSHGLHHPRNYGQVLYLEVQVFDPSSALTCQQHLNPLHCDAPRIAGLLETVENGCTNTVPRSFLFKLALIQLSFALKLSQLVHRKRINPILSYFGLVWYLAVCLVYLSSVLSSYFVQCTTQWTEVLLGCKFPEKSTLWMLQYQSHSEIMDLPA